MLKITGDKYEVEELVSTLKYLNYTRVGENCSSKDFMSVIVETNKEEESEDHHNEKVEKIVVSFVLLRFNSSLDNIKYGPKSKELVKCRKYISVFMKKYSTLSSTRIGQIVNRSRFTVLYYIREHNADLYNYRDVQEEHALLQKLIEQKL